MSKQIEINYFEFEHNYKERTRRHKFDKINVRTFKHMLQGTSKIYEVLLDNPVKLFIDVDGIPKDKDLLIYEIIFNFINFMKTEFNITINDYALTKNVHSISHEGLSYHIYFPEYYVDKIFKIKYILTLFIKNYNEYYDYIDGCIYHYNRLFRCVNQLNASTKSNNENDDIHLLEHGTISDTIIQYCSKSELIPIDINDIKFKKIKGVVLKNQSFDQEKIKLKKTIQYQKNKIKSQRLMLTKFTSFDTSINAKTIDELKNDLKYLLKIIQIDAKLYDIDNFNENQLKSFVNKLFAIKKLKEDLIKELNKTLNNN